MKNTVINIEIKNPLYVHGMRPFVYISDKYIKKAKKTGKLLRIKTPFGTGIVSYKDWLTNAKFMEKVFLRPDEPMKLWGNYVPV